jgi:hypothetical protein
MYSRSNLTSSGDSFQPNFVEKTADNIVLQDENLVVRSVTLSSSKYTKTTKRKRGKLESTSKDLAQETQCLICVGPRVPGKFDASAAKKLGVKPGPLYAKLSAGESVISSTTGKSVHPSEVLKASKQAAVIIVVDCPSIDLIDSLVKSKDFAPYFTERAASCIFHMVSDEVLKDTRYQKWMNKFKDGAKHIISGDRYASRQTFRVESAKLRSAMNRVDSGIFPLSVSPSYADNDELLKSLTCYLTF